MQDNRRFLFVIALSASCIAAQAQVHKDIEYAHPGSENLKLDACVPDGAGPFPAAIIVHGGAWRAGDKQFRSVVPLFDPLTKAGFAWFSINYRLAPKRDAAGAPARNYLADQVEDVESAVRWVKAHAREYKVDTKRIALVGESAGAHLIAMVALQDKPATRVAAAVPFYGPFDLEGIVPEARRKEKIFADLVGATGLDEKAYVAQIKKESPINFVHKGVPPFLLIHGTGDKTVPYSESPKLCEKIKSAGGNCEVFPIEGADHGIGKWEANPAFQAYKPKMIEWLEANLK